MWRTSFYARPSPPFTVETHYVSPDGVIYWSRKKAMAAGFFEELPAAPSGKKNEALCCCCVAALGHLSLGRPGLLAWPPWPALLPASPCALGLPARLAALALATESGLRDAPG